MFGRRVLFLILVAATFMTSVGCTRPGDSRDSVLGSLLPQGSSEGYGGNKPPPPERLATFLDALPGLKGQGEDKELFCRSADFETASYLVDRYPNAEWGSSLQRFYETDPVVEYSLFPKTEAEEYYRSSIDFLFPVPLRLQGPNLVAKRYGDEELYSPGWTQFIGINLEEAGPSKLYYVFFIESCEKATIYKGRAFNVGLIGVWANDVLYNRWMICECKR